MFCRRSGLSSRLVVLVDVPLLQAPRKDGSDEPGTAPCPAERIRRYPETLARVLRPDGKDAYFLGYMVLKLPYPA